MKSSPSDDPFSAWIGSVSRLLSAYKDLSASTSIHGETLGKAREEFVSKILRDFLPRALHTGSGQVIDVDGRLSRQIDIVIYRGDMPLLPSLAGTNLYFAEGVVSAIEVKSKLDAPKLREALDNCRSVKSLNVEVPITRGTTYIFGYLGYKNRLSALKDALLSWIREQGIDDVFELPDVIATEGCVVVKNTSRVFDRNSFRRKLGYDAIFIAAVEKTPLRWVLHHLLGHIGNDASAARVSIDQVLRRNHIPRQAFEDRAEFWGKWDPFRDRGRIENLE